MENSKLKFSEYMQNIIRSKSNGKFIFIVFAVAPQLKTNKQNKFWNQIKIRYMKVVVGSLVVG